MKFLWVMVILLLVGCGSDSNEPGSTPTTSPIETSGAEGKVDPAAATDPASTPAAGAAMATAPPAHSNPAQPNPMQPQNTKREFESFEQVRAWWGRPLLKPDDAWAQVWMRNGDSPSQKDASVYVSVAPKGTDPAQAAPTDGKNFSVMVMCNPDSAYEDPAAPGPNQKVKGYRAYIQDFYEGPAPVGSDPTWQRGDSGFDMRMVRWVDSSKCTWMSMSNSRSRTWQEMLQLLDSFGLV